MNKEVLTGKLFKILPIFEESKPNQFERYISRLAIELSGCEESYSEELVCILKGIKKNMENITHDEIKSVVFHMIALIKEK